MAAAPAGPADYDLMVLVVARDTRFTQVSLSYSRVMDHGLLRESIDEMMARTHGRAEAVVVEDGPLGRGVGPQATAAQFAAPGLLDRESGVLPVGVVARSLPEWQRMRLAFLVEERFPFYGPEDTSADGLVVRLVNAVAAYEYDVERSSGTTVAPAAPVPAQPGAISLLPAVLIGLPTGLLLGWAFGDRRGREVPVRRSRTVGARAERGGRKSGS
jgi:hypothetical protein